MIFGGSLQSLLIPVAGLFALTFTAPVSEAPLLPSEMTEVGRAAIAEEFLSERLDLWKQRLKLEDWRIALEMVGPDDLRSGTLGNIRWDFDDGTGKTATIRVLNVTAYGSPLDETLDDMEFTVVHELLHLAFAKLPRSDASRSDEEHAVNQVTEALLHLERRD